MIGRNLFGMVALVPLALNMAVPAQGAVMMPMCIGDGSVVLVPLGAGGSQPGKTDNGCCIKGCHAGSNRKKLNKLFEPAQ